MDRDFGVSFLKYNSAMNIHKDKKKTCKKLSFADGLHNVLCCKLRWVYSVINL